ncbi:hypothetical protein TSC_c10180 [Thermus scotoductus SA-01]|uniref:Uncharacterized protein n=2 Tax=Thermaceae TaxID=188786 RepID=E8PPH4_THESS|nr:hypothetical protein TSC_c10180 [Thermus scotoductus SA-01]
MEGIAPDQPASLLTQGREAVGGDMEWFREGALRAVQAAQESFRWLQPSISALALDPVSRAFEHFQRVFRAVERFQRPFRALEGVQRVFRVVQAVQEAAQKPFRLLRDLLYRDALVAAQQALQEAWRREALGGGRVRRVRLDSSTLPYSLLTRFFDGRRLNIRKLILALLSLFFLPTVFQAVNGDQEPEEPSRTAAPLGPDPPRPLIRLIVPRTIQPIAGPSAA